MRKRRSYSIVFGSPLILPDDYFIAPLSRGSNPVLALEAYYNENDPNAYKIDKHEISFKVVKKEKATNTAEITIDNLSSSTISYLLDHLANNLVVLLKVGYDDDNVLLFHGTMKECSVSKVGETSKTKVVVNDGSLNTTSAYSSRTFPVGTPAQSIVDDLILDMAFPRGGVIPLPKDAILTTPYSVMGNTKFALDRLLSGYSYTSSINEGMCYILPDNKRMASNVSYISPETGLIGSVQGLVIQATSQNVVDTDTSKKKRIRFTCQMDATLTPQSSVYVKDLDMEVDGAYKIEKSTFYSSSFETGSWFVKVDAVEIDATVVPL